MTRDRDEQPEHPKSPARRTFLLGAAATTGVVALGGVAATRVRNGGSRGATSVHTEMRPGDHNLLVLLCDDMRWDELSYMPFLEGLAKEHGTNFTQTRQSTSMCSPARATFLRGQVATGPHGHGITLQSDNPTPIVDDTVAVWLRDAGVHTNIVGKYFVGLTRRIQPGWDRMVISAGPKQSHQYGYTIMDLTPDDEPIELEPPEPQVEFLAEATSEIIAQAPSPWFIWYCPHEPHGPLEPLPDSKAAMIGVDWPFSTEGLDSKPTWVRSLPEPTDQDVALMQSMQRNRLAELLDLDAAIELLWDELEATGTLEDTILLITSDNGNSLLDYGRLPILGKNYPYDISARVPLIAIGPGFPPGAEIDTTVSAGIDMAATCLEAGGATATVPQHGISLLEIARDPDSFAERAMVGGNDNRPDSDTTMPHSDWVVVGGRKLIRYRDTPEPDTYEAYDVDTDQYEHDNWAGDESRRRERDELEAILDNLLDDPSGQSLPTPNN